MIIEFNVLNKCNIIINLIKLTLNVMLLFVKLFPLKVSVLVKWIYVIVG